MRSRADRRSASARARGAPLALAAAAVVLAATACDSPTEPTPAPFACVFDVAAGEIVPTAACEGELIRKEGGRAIAMIVGARRVDFAGFGELLASGCADRPVQTVAARVFDGIGRGPDPLLAAAVRTVDVWLLTPDEPSYRKDCRTLHRLDGRPPAVIFLEGFEPRDVDGESDLGAYVLWDHPSPFVSTTYRHDLFLSWGVPYQYYLDVPGGIDVNATLGSQHRYAAEEEVAFPGGVARRFIVKACPVDLVTLELEEDRCVDNPRYVPWR